MRPTDITSSASLSKMIGFGCNRFVSMFCYGAIVQMINQAPNRVFFFTAGTIGVLSAIVFLCAIGIRTRQTASAASAKKNVWVLFSLTAVGIALVSMARMTSAVDSFASFCFCAGCLTLSIGSAGLFFCWGAAFSESNGKTILAEFCGGFVGALILLVPFNLFGTEMQSLALIAACLADATAIQRIKAHRPIDTPKQYVSKPEDVAWIRKKIYFGMACYGVAMGLSTSLLPHTGQAVYLEESLMRLICGLVIFGATALFAYHIKRHPLLTSYRLAYLIIALNTTVLLLLFNKEPFFLAALFVGHLLIIATCMTLLFTIAGSIPEEKSRIIAFGVAVFLFGDLLVRSAHDLLLMSGTIHPETLALFISAALIGMIVISYALVFTERDIEKVQRLTDAAMLAAKIPISEISYEDAARDLGDRYGLTSREREVLSLLLMGRSSPRIQGELFISESTVHTHTRHIYAKTGVRSRQELIDLFTEWISHTQASSS